MYVSTERYSPQVALVRDQEGLFLITISDLCFTKVLPDIANNPTPCSYIWNNNTKKQDSKQTLHSYKCEEKNSRDKQTKAERQDESETATQNGCVIFLKLLPLSELQTFSSFFLSFESFSGSWYVLVRSGSRWHQRSSSEPNLSHKKQERRYYTTTGGEDERRRKRMEVQRAYPSRNNSVFSATEKVASDQKVKNCI